MKLTPKQERLIENKLRKLMKEDFFHTLDKLMDEITYDELITTIESNERTPYTEQTVNKVFNEIITGKVRDAKSSLKTDMAKILKTLNQSRKNY